jgi:hypothetical protein
MNKKLLVTCLIFLLFLFGICSQFLMNNKDTKRQVIGEQTETINKPQNSLFAIKNNPTPTPTWKFFNEPKLNYSLRYPPNWTNDNWNIQDAANIKGTADGNIWGHARFSGENKQLEIIAWGNKTKTPIVQWLTWYRHEDLELNKLPKEPNFTFLGEQAVRVFQEKTSFSYPVVRIFFQKGNFLYEILYRMDILRGIAEPTDAQMQEEPNNTILQSLKFTL